MQSMMMIYHFRLCVKHCTILYVHDSIFFQRSIPSIYN